MNDDYTNINFAIGIAVNHVGLRPAAENLIPLSKAINAIGEARAYEAFGRAVYRATQAEILEALKLRRAECIGEVTRIVSGQSGTRQ